jgi:hypothetical protein
MYFLDYKLQFKKKQQKIYYPIFILLGGLEYLHVTLLVSYTYNIFVCCWKN